MHDFATGIRQRSYLVTGILEPLTGSSCNIINSGVYNFDLGPFPQKISLPFSGSSAIRKYTVLKVY